MRALLAVLILLTVAFAGCASNDDDDKDGEGLEGTETASGTGTGTGNSTRSETGASGGSQSGTGTGSGGANRAPLANMTASTVEGVAPFNVTFNFTASDPDGDAFTWVLVYGDNQTATGDHPRGNISHTFEAAGNYTAELIVTDAGGLNATSSVAILVTAAAGGAIPPPITFTGSFMSAFDSPAVHTFTLGAGVGKATFHMEFEQMIGGFPEVDNDLDWDIAGPGGQGGSTANYGPEPDMVVDAPGAGGWTITLTPYSVFPTGLDYTVTVTFA